MDGNFQKEKRILIYLGIGFLVILCLSFGLELLEEIFEMLYHFR